MGDNQTPGIILEEGRLNNDDNHSISSTNNNDNQSRSKGANSADLSSLDPQQPGGRSSLLSRGSIQEDSSIFLQQLEKQLKQRLADHAYDVSTRRLLVRELKGPQTYNDKEDKDI